MKYLTFAEADKLIAEQSAEKQPKAAASKPPAQAKQPKPEIQKGLDAHDQIVAAGRNPTEEAIREKAGIGIRAAGKARGTLG